MMSNENGSNENGDINDAADTIDTGMDDSGNPERPQVDQQMGDASGGENAMSNNAMEGQQHQDDMMATKPAAAAVAAEAAAEEEGENTSTTYTEMETNSATTTSNRQRAGEHAELGEDATKRNDHGDDDATKQGGYSSESDSESGDESSSSSSSSSSSDSDNNEDYTGLSEYEVLRLKNIKRNQKRLKKLGLLTTSSSSGGGGVGIAGMAAGIGNAASAAASSSSNGSSQPRKRRQSAPVPRRSLPRRRCAKLKRFSLDFSDTVPSDTPSTSNNNKSTQKKMKGAVKRNATYDDGYDSDESSMASPIPIRRILHPQPHQQLVKQSEKDVKHYKKTRRLRRGRPKREEYEYKCDEKCKECGGEWKFDMNNEDVEEETRLIRCKDCKCAFHPKCMLIHGKGEESEKKKNEVGAVEQEDGKVALDDVEGQDDDQMMEAPQEVARGGSSERDRMIAADDIEAEEEAKKIAASVERTEQGGAEGEAEKIVEADEDRKMAAVGNNAVETEDKEASANDVEPDEDDRKMAAVERGAEEEEAKVSAEPQADEDDRKIAAEGEAEGEERKIAAVADIDSEASRDNSDENDEPLSTRDPKRCFKCEAKYRLQQKQKSTKGNEKKEDGNEGQTNKKSTALCLLEATIGDRTVRVRVTPEPVLEATIDGKDVTCVVSFSGQSSGNGEPRGIGSTQRVTWKSPLEEEEAIIEMNPTTKQIQKLINRALNEPDHARLQDYTAAQLRKYLSTPELTSTVVKLGGIRMLKGAMEDHPSRPILQAEVLCTLSEIIWACPELSIETVRSGCLDLAITALDEHPTQSKVLQMGMTFFRSLSYDAECCDKLKKSIAVSSVVEGIRRNPRKLNVMLEGSGFLQNMMVVSQSSTIKCILPKRRSKDDGRPELIPTLLNAVESNSKISDLALCVFGLLSNVALTPKGIASLKSLDTHLVQRVCSQTLQENPNSIELRDIVQSFQQSLSDD